MFTPYKHLSFDVWNTLIEPNLTYSKLRTECISDHFEITPQSAKELYTTTKRFLDKSAEISGICMDTDSCWKLLKAMAKNDTVDLSIVQAETSALFSQNLPIVNDGIVSGLQHLKEQGFSLGIVSNTNFTKGAQLFSEIFKEWDVFNFALFSDEELFAKPNKKLFDLMLYNASVSYGSFLDTKDILHIGDNTICDGDVVKFGYGFMYVKNPVELSTHLTTFGW